MPATGSARCRPVTFHEGAPGDGRADWHRGRPGTSVWLVSRLWAVFNAGVRGGWSADCPGGGRPTGAGPREGRVDPEHLLGRDRGARRRRAAPPPVVSGVSVATPCPVRGSNCLAASRSNRRVSGHACPRERDQGPWRRTRRSGRGAGCFRRRRRHDRPSRCFRSTRPSSRPRRPSSPSSGGSQLTSASDASR